MNAILGMVSDDEPRLYSNGYSAETPIDVVAPQHQVVHELLMRWGNWARPRQARGGLASIESFYTKGGTPPSTAPLSADIALIRVEIVVLKMPRKHAATLRRMYVWRMASVSVAQMAKVRPEKYAEWTFTCRAMMVNLLRRLGG